MEMKTKTFDAVEMSRRLRAQTSRKHSAMTPVERRATLRKARARSRLVIAIGDDL